MAEIFRVEKSKNFTIMSNYHLKDKRLTLKAKGLLSQILSLPEDWDYTIKGLAYINVEKVDAIRTAVLELERNGYITRSRERNERGHLLGTVYTIREEPLTDVESGMNTEVEPKLDYPILDNPTLEKPRLDNPALENPALENPTQLNTNKSNTKKSITDNINHSINQSTKTSENDGLIDRSQKTKSNYRDYYKWIKNNIEYDFITDIGNRQIKYKDDVERIDEIIDVMVDMLFPEKPMVRIGDCEFPHEVVKSRLSKITSEHIIYIIDCLDKNTTKIKNMAAYLRKTIYNAPTTYSNYVTSDVNNMLHGG